MFKDEDGRTPVLPPTTSLLEGPAPNRTDFLLDGPMSGWTTHPRTVTIHPHGFVPKSTVSPSTPTKDGGRRPGDPRIFIRSLRWTGTRER